MHPQITAGAARHLSQQGLTGREAALVTGVPVRTVRNWRTGIRRGPGRKRNAKCPRCTGRPLGGPAQAYLPGLTSAVDGSRAGGVTSSRWTSVLRWLARPPRGRGEAGPAVVPASRVFTVRRVGMTEVRGTSKHWPCLFRGTDRGASTRARSSSPGGSGSSRKRTEGISQGAAPLGRLPGRQPGRRSWGAGKRWHA